MLTYDEQGRAFWNGERCPRTTEICSLLAPRTWAADEYYLRKGTLIHRIVEWEDSGELDESTVDPLLAGYLEAFRRFKAETGWLSVKLETSFFHRKYRYCGRVDKYGLFKGKRWEWVLDIKSGQPHEADRFQAPAYLFGIKSHGFPVEKCGDLYLKSDGTYRLKEVERPSVLFQQFLGGVKRWREENT